MTARTAWTYQDYAALPDDGKRYEILDGELHAMIAPLDVILSDEPTHTTILQPDIVYLDHRRLDAIRMRGIAGAPALAVEVLSPSTAVIDRTRKRESYARYGVSYFWLVDLDAVEIEADVLHAGEYVAAATASRNRPAALPPFLDLVLVPSAIWPQFPIRP